MGQALVFEYLLTILEKHLDMYGHVNNATYLALYEEARWDFITKRGYGLEYIRESGRGPILLAANITFRRELVNRETILITSQYVGEKNPRVGMLHQEMIKPDGKVASTLDIEVGLFDLKERKLIKPNDEWKDALGIV